MLDSTPPSEVQEQFYQARKKIGDVANDLPAGVIGPLVNDEYADVTFALLFALKAKGEPQRLLVRDAETQRQRLLHVPGVKKVDIIGEQAERIYVQLSHDRLATLGVAPQDVFAALNGQNLLTPAGSVETRGPEIFIRVEGAFDKLQKIRDTPIVAQGRTLKLSDIATVERGYEPVDVHDPQQRRTRAAARRRDARRLERPTSAARWTGKSARSTRRCRSA